MVSNSSDNSIFFCRLDDLSVSLVELKTYQLTISLTNILFVNSYSSSIISVFTCLGLASDRLILDWNPTFAELAMYTDYTTITSPPVIISTLATSPSSFTMLNTLEIILTLTFNNYYSASNSMMIVKWPTDILASGPTSIQIAAATSGKDPSIYIPTSGNVSISPVPGKIDQVFINGIVDDFSQEDHFFLF